MGRRSRATVPSILIHLTQRRNMVSPARNDWTRFFLLDNRYWETLSFRCGKEGLIFCKRYFGRILFHSWKTDKISKTRKGRLWGYLLIEKGDRQISPSREWRLREWRHRRCHLPKNREIKRDLTFQRRGIDRVSPRREWRLRERRLRGSPLPGKRD
jgi:hypothetical protein